MIRTLFLLGASDNKEKNTLSRERIAPGVIKMEADLTGVVPILRYIMNDRTVDLHLKLTQDLHLILTHPERQIMA